MRLGFKIKEAIATAIGLAGYRITRQVSIGERFKVKHPLDVLGVVPLAVPVLIEVPIARLRGWCWRSLDASVHPFVKFLGEYRASGDSSYAKSCLSEFYASYCPRNACEFLGINESEAPGFSDLHPAASVLPWNFESPEERLLLVDRIERIDSSQYGKTLTIADGTNLFGPISAAKGEFEVARLVSTFRAISAKGYRRNNGPDGDVTGNILVGDDDDWCVNVIRGQHRIAVAAALGMESLPVRAVNAPIRKCDSKYWPQVLAGRITVDGARKVFDRIMRGQG